VLHIFAGYRMDRVAERRRDPAWLSDRLADPATRVVPVLGLKSLVIAGDSPRAEFLPPTSLAPDAEPIFLGEMDGGVYFAVELDEAAGAALEGEGGFAELRPLGALLDRGEAAMLAYARAMVYWHRRHRHCGECGAPTRSEEAGHLRRCTRASCGAVHFPRTDPAIIVLVTRGERCLLGRQASWPAGQYSTLAGFVEPGESLEDAVAREVREETGVGVGEIEYHSSQPWPFPSSLMLGFTAVASGDLVQVDGLELEDARWFTREELREGIREGRLRLPNPASIAFALVDGWLRD
jgi:NAD+ diphosphatase